MAHGRPLSLLPKGINQHLEDRQHNNNNKQHKHLYVSVHFTPPDGVYTTPPVGGRGLPPLRGMMKRIDSSSRGIHHLFTSLLSVYSLLTSGLVIQKGVWGSRGGERVDRISEPMYYIYTRKRAHIMISSGSNMENRQCQATKPAVEPEVTAALGRLEMEIEDVMDAFEALVSRLILVIHPGPVGMEKKGIAPADFPSSPMAIRLDMSLRKVTELRMRIQSVLGLLEI